MSQPVSWSLLFVVAIILTLVLKYAIPRKERCPECQELRDPEHPLCTSCGMIYDVPGEENDDYGDVPEKVEPWR